MGTKFKDRIALLMTKKGLGVTKFAAVLDKSETAVRSWESGRSKPDAGTLISLSRYFDVSVDYLLGLDSFGNHAEKSAADSKT